MSILSEIGTKVGTELKALDDKIIASSGGKVLQVKHIPCTTAITSTIAGWVDISMNGSITPKSTTSKLLVEWRLHLYSNSGNTAVWESINVRLKSNGNILWTDKSYHALGSYSTWTMMPGTFKHQYTPGTLSTQNYTVEVDANNDDQSLNINCYGEGYITITEIAE